LQVNPAVVQQLESAGMTFVGHDTEGKRMEIMELQGIRNKRMMRCFLFVLPCSLIVVHRLAGLTLCLEVHQHSVNRLGVYPGCGFCCVVDAASQERIHTVFL
jgi:hypothetical protein